MMPKTCTIFYLPLIRHEQQFGLGLALRKETLRRQGVLASAKSRDPGPRSGSGRPGRAAMPVRPPPAESSKPLTTLFQEGLNG